MSAPRRIPLLAAILAALALTAGGAGAQCMLANPSFEVNGSGGYVFGGWEQFGDHGSTGEAFHGQQAALLHGPDGGGWDVSGYWQSLDCEEGERWEITGQVRHPAERPLQDECTALVNVEWRDAAGGLISFDSFIVADASSPAGPWMDFALTSSPAPAGTWKARLLIGVLQSPGAPSPEVHFDQITFTSTTPPLLDDLQWVDFPGGRSVDFAGRSWRVKGTGWYGPGPSLFGHTEESVWVDTEGLHLSIRDLGGAWYSTEVVLEEALGYGDYVVTARGALDQLDVHAVLGLFLWQYGPCWDEAYLWWNPFNEIDVEISRWGNPGNGIGQFVAQPWDWPGNLVRFDAAFGPEELSSYAFRWLADRVEFRAWRGGPGDESAETLILDWTYAGPHVPRPEQPRLHMNLWQFTAPPAVEQEVVIAGFRFSPESATGLPGASPLLAAARLLPAWPNPFNPETRIRFEMPRSAMTEVSVHDVDGARVRTLFRGFAGEGVHELRWDGRDDQGRPQASGIYLCTLRSGTHRQSRRLALIK